MSIARANKKDTFQANMCQNDDEQWKFHISWARNHKHSNGMLKIVTTPEYHARICIVLTTKNKDKENYGKNIITLQYGLCACSLFWHSNIYLYCDNWSFYRFTTCHQLCFETNTYKSIRLNVKAFKMGRFDEHRLNFETV